MRLTAGTLARCSLLGLVGFLGMAGWAWGDSSLPPREDMAVQPAFSGQVQPFPLSQVRLLDGPFRHAQELDRDFLLSLDPNRLLHTFRVNAGLPTQAAPLGGWEEPKGELRGHSTGHYLSACALMFASTGDERLKQKGDAVVAGLAECQAKIGSGYLSAYPEEFIDRVEAQKPVWAPYYTLHKILAGLIDMYHFAGNKQALEVACKFADWVVTRNDRLDDPAMQAMLGNEHGGMNEALANLYALTGNKNYLRTSLHFNHQAVIDPASKGTDSLTGLHANTQVPKFIGTARQFELTGRDDLKKASSFFWDTVVNERSYVIGGHSDGEHFSPKETLSRAFGPSTTETCNTYNMLKLTRHLFCWDPAVPIADYYERALINHILCSQNPLDGMMCYYVPLRSGSQKVYNTPLDSFWCCTGTGIENHAKYGDSIYYHQGADVLYVSQFMASELDWKDLGLKITQQTAYPNEQATRLVLHCEKPIPLKLKLRHPRWATSGFSLTVNGQSPEQAGASQPGSWVTLDRVWKDGDQIEVALPFVLSKEGFRDNPRRVAFLHGPLVLAAEVKTENPQPVVTSDDGIDPAVVLKPVPGKPSTFQGSPEVFMVAGWEGDAKIIFEPFFQLHGGRRYVVYWDDLTPAQSQARLAEKAAEAARLKALEARTVDHVQPGNRDSERAHAQDGRNSQSGLFQDRAWRHAVDGGFFSWLLAVEPGTPQVLSVTYWGSDAGNRVFDIQLDGTTLATQRLQHNRPDAFYEELYPLPPELLRGKQSVTIRFQAKENATAGGVFDVRILRNPEAGQGAAKP